MSTDRPATVVLAKQGVLVHALLVGGEVLLVILAVLALIVWAAIDSLRR